MAYNECEALTTYLLSLRLAHIGGFICSGEYADEQQRVRELLEREGESPGKEHLNEFMEEWNRKQDE